jgi:cytochrome b involved in lipid metabolism
MKKIIYIVVLLIVLVGGYFAYTSWKEESDLEVYANNAVTSSVNSTYTMAQVSTHTTRTDCWMVIDGDVLNVSTFVDKHPGGDRILEGCGKDASSYFHGVPEHMKGIVKKIYQSLIIGKLKQ